MSDTQESPFMDKDSAELFGAIVAHNVATLAHTTESIEQYLRDEISVWQKRYAALYWKVDEQAQTLTTRPLEHTLAHHSYYYDEAVRALEAAPQQ